MEDWVELRGKELLLKVLKNPKGDEANAVKNGDAVLLDLEGWNCGVDGEPPGTDLVENEDNKNQIFQRAKSWLVIVGEKDVVEGLDIGLANMKEGQTACIFCHGPKFGLGEGNTRKYQDCHVEPNANLVYKATVTSIVQDTSRLNPYFTLQKALTRKKIANDLYQHELLILSPKELAPPTPPSSSADNNNDNNTIKNQAAKMQALKLYRQAGRDMKDLLGGTYFNSVEQDHPQRKECRQLMMDCYNNVVVIYMHTKEYQKALDAAEIALQRDSKNLKAMIRSAKLHVLLASSEKKLKEADEAIKMAENAICYKDKAEETELKKIGAQYKQRRKQVLGKE